MPSGIRTPGLCTALLTLALSASSRAETTAAEPAPAPIAEPAKIAPAPEPSHPPTEARHEHLISAPLAAALAESLPKYDPLAKTTGLNGDETGQSKNGIIRLKKFIVKQPKPPVFTQSQLLTPQGKIELMKKRHPGLKLGGALNGGIALLMYQEEERLENLADLADEVRDARNSGDSAGAATLAREHNSMAYRPSAIGGGAPAPGH